MKQHDAMLPIAAKRESRDGTDFFVTAEQQTVTCETHQAVSYRELLDPAAVKANRRLPTSHVRPPYCFTTNRIARPATRGPMAVSTLSR